MSRFTGLESERTCYSACNADSDLVLGENSPVSLFRYSDKAVKHLCVGPGEDSRSCTYLLSKMAPERFPKKGPGGAAKAYLILYNSVQVLGWSYLLYQIIFYYLSGQYKNEKLWNVVSRTVIIFQNAAMLEVLHVILGIVKSGLFLTAMQVYSRVLVVCGVLISVPVSQDSIGLPLCLLCWAITEIIRYAFYALTLINSVPYFLLWCRYTFFIVLYPFGITGELLCIYAAQAYVAEHKTFTLEMPNNLNATFSYQYFLIANMFGYIPGFPQLYLYMFSQRKKVLTSPGKEKKSS